MMSALTWTMQDGKSAQANLLATLSGLLFPSNSWVKLEGREEIDR